MEVVQSLWQINYWGDQVSLGGTDTAITKLFGGHDSVDTNDLGVRGELPDNRIGQITGIFFKVFQKYTNDPSTACLNWQALTEVIEKTWFTIYVNNTRHTRGPIAAFPHPPIWFSGLITQDGTSEDGGFGLVQNSGYMLFHQNIEVDKQQSIRVEVESKTDYTASVSTTILECQLQTLDGVAA